MRTCRHFVLLLVAFLAYSAGACGADYYGAIAYSPSNGARGWSYDYATRGAAEQRAQSECAQHGSGCKVILWFRNACGALAIGSNGYGSGWGSDEGLADQWAIKTCSQHTSNCKVVRRVGTTR